MELNQMEMNERIKTWKMLFLILVDLSEKDRRRAGGSSLRALRTNPPRPSSSRLSRSAAGSTPEGPPPPASPPPPPPRNDVIDERMLFLGRKRDAIPNGALVRTP